MIIRNSKNMKWSKCPLCNLRVYNTRKKSHLCSEKEPYLINPDVNDIIYLLDFYNERQIKEKLK